MNKLKAKHQCLERIFETAGFAVSTRIVGSQVEIKLKKSSRDEHLILRGPIPFGHDHKKPAYAQLVRGAKTYESEV